MDDFLKEFVKEKHQLETSLEQLMEVPAHFNDKRQTIETNIQQLVVKLFYCKH